MMVEDIKLKNTQKSVRTFWIAMVVLSMITFFIGTRIDTMNGGAALSMVSIFAFISSIIIVIIFNKRSKYLDKAIEGKEYIAHFKFAKAEWKELMKYELNYRWGNNIAIFIVLAVMFVVIFGIFILFISEGKLAMFLAMLGFIAFFGVIAFLIPLFSYLFGTMGGANIIIMEKGVLFNRSFHSWDFPLSFLSSIGHRKEPNVLEITYEFVDRLGPRSYTVNVPIPKDEVVNVDQIINKLAKANDLEEKKGKFVSRSGRKKKKQVNKKKTSKKNLKTVTKK